MVTGRVSEGKGLAMRKGGWARERERKRKSPLERGRRRGESKGEKMKEKNLSSNPTGLTTHGKSWLHFLPPKNVKRKVTRSASLGFS